MDIDLSELSYENYLTKNFDRSIRRQIDKLGKRTKSYLEDLKILRNILTFLIHFLFQVYC
jgi:hypothetical protein